MNMPSIAEDIERAIVLEAEIEVRTVELKAIKKRLDAAALRGPHQPLEDKDRDGKQYIARGRTHRVPIIITSDNLAKELTKDGPQHLRILNVVSAEQFALFYKPENKFAIRWEDGKKFRQKALELLGEKLAPPFITACLSVDKDGIPKNKIIVALDRAELLATEGEGV